MKNITDKQMKIISIALASWGVLLIGSGTTMSIMAKPVEKPKVELKVIQKRVATTKTNEIKLKDMELEINQPLSVNVKDYLEDVDNIEDKIIRNLKLDTSMVNVNEAGTYTYTISYKKKKYNGTFKIKEKALPEMASMTLKTLNLQIGTALSTDVQTYIVETLTDEVKANVKLNLTNVNTAQAGNYQYTVTYNGKLYTGTITIYQPQIVNTPTPAPPTGNDPINPNGQDNANDKQNEGTESNSTEQNENP